MSKIKIIIADDIRILRQGLKAVLSTDPDMDVVALCENGMEAYEQTKLQKPDVVLMDMRMPEFDGEFGIKKIKAEFPEVKILVLTTFDDDETVKKALSSGADGYILKESEDEKVIASIKQVHSGISVFGSSVFNALKSQLLNATQNNTSSQGEQTSQNENNSDDTSSATYKNSYGEEITFTPRERDVLKLVSLGFDNKEIAKKLYIAEGTTRNQISRLLEKTGLKDRTQLAVYAVKNGLDL